MISCDRCEQWFHGQCVGKADELPGAVPAGGEGDDNDGDVWLCRRCRRCRVCRTEDDLTPIIACRYWFSLSLSFSLSVRRTLTPLLLQRVPRRVSSNVPLPTKGIIC